MQHAEHDASALVFGTRTEIERAQHAECGIEVLGWVGVDGKGARGCAGVHGDEAGGTAADYGDEGGCGEGEEGGGTYGEGEGAEVFLAVLCWGEVLVQFDGLEMGERGKGRGKVEGKDELRRRNAG